MIAIFLGKKIEILKYSFIEDLIYSVALKQRQKTMTVLDSFYPLLCTKFISERIFFGFVCLFVHFNSLFSMQADLMISDLGQKME